MAVPQTSTDRLGSDPALDDPVWWALTGAQRRFGTVRGGTARFDPAVASFGAFDGPPASAHWDAMAELVGPGGDVVVIGDGLHRPPSGWTVVREGPGVQMVCERLAAPSNPPLSPVTPQLLGRGDVADMQALVKEANPGPFRERTHELGRYVGIRDGGRLVAMAGERLRVPGFTEISAVATLPSHRRRGLAAALVWSVAAGIRDEGSLPFLNVAAQNEAAIRLYAALGFRTLRTQHFRFLRRSGTPS